ncbi:MAG: exodeoxyribonuclease V subunit gamma [Deltaproteobacteria bacterium]
MKVFVSNQLENLVQCLAGELNAPLQQPLTPEIIVVQSTGMAKWISLKLAARHGIAANYRFPFPKKFLEEIFSAFLPDYSPDLSFDEHVLTWKILEMLPVLSEDDDFLPVRRYLGGSNDQQKMYQLAKKLAEMFDQYVIFRPEMILEWEEGVPKAHDVWQVKLWKALVYSQGRMHPARMRKLFLSAVKSKPCKPGALPERLSIFGISYLPPYYLDIFSRLSIHLPVDYYYFNPSREFWADIRSQREIGSVLSKTAKHPAIMDDDSLHLESGNSLLASWGRQGRDFFRLMENVSADTIDLFEKTEAGNLLSSIQSDIQLLEEPRAYGIPSPPRSFDDDSIQVHSCHSPLREVEALHDTVLQLLEKNSRLTPRDVLVMTPRIELYAPYIEAVFDARDPKIPYTIADRGSFSANVAGLGLMALLDLADSRFTADSVLSILENGAVSDKFEISSGDLELIRHWISQTRIKWGIDAAHRATYDLPPFGQNTWMKGLERLLAGVTLDGRRHELFGEILPYGRIESGETQVLGRFLTFWEKVINLRALILVPRPLAEWCGILRSILEDFLSSSELYRRELYDIRQRISSLEAEQRQAASTQDISLGIVKDCIRDGLDSQGAVSGFLAGGVSFCALLPMRSIPFHVICLIGMDHDVFPRRDRQTGFNLMEKERRAGDRSLRSDDQYLFLEALLSARQNLIISYVGQSAADNSEMLPSVLVSELLDYIDRNYGDSKEQPLSGMITRKHRLHAFSQAYFAEDKTLFSYSRQHYQAAWAILGRKIEKQPFFEQAIPEEADPSRIIPIRDLASFYRKPAKYFLENRLCLKLPAQLWEEEASEPFTIDHLCAYQIRQALVESYLGGGDGGNIFKLKKAEGVLPVGAAGDYYFQLLTREARDFTDRISAYLKGRQPRTCTVDLPVGNDRLTGTLDNLYGDCRIQYRMAGLKTGDYLDAWIAHLILNTAASEDGPEFSLLLGRDGFWRFRPVQNARNILTNLVAIYRTGRTRPLKFFPRSSWEYAETLWLKNKSRPESIDAANRVWLGNEYRAADGESQETPHKICFEDETPMDGEFEKTAEDILKELFTHLEKLE